MGRSRFQGQKTVATSETPVYPVSRAYSATQVELSQAGVKSVHGLVELLNGRLLREQRLPVTVGDYPTNKAKFRKILLRAHSLGLLSVDERESA